MPTSPYSVTRERREQRQKRLRAMGFPDYQAYLRSAHWQRIKALYRNSGEPQDCICGETTSLHLHHLTYERVGAEKLSDLTPLCGNCHAMIHALESRGEIGLDFTGFVSAKRAERYEAQQQGLVERRNGDLMSRERRDHDRRDQIRSVLARLRSVMVQAVKDDRDISDTLHQLDSACHALEADLRGERVDA